MYYVHALYERYFSLKQALESRDRFSTSVLSLSDYCTPLDTQDFVSLAYGESADIFNLQLYSQVLRALRCDRVVLSDVAPSRERSMRGIVGRNTVGVSRGTNRLMKVMAGTASLILAQMVKPKVMLDGLNMNCFHLLRLIRTMALRGWALPGPQRIKLEIQERDEAARKGIGSIPAWDEFSSVLIQTLPINFPQIYLESYADVRECCLNMWPRTPKVLVSSGGWYCNESFKFLAAEFGERGARLVGVQHGGGYGASKILPQEQFECSISDRWFSYGWNDLQRDSKVKPLPHPRFAPLRTSQGSGSENQQNILLVATTHPRYSFRFESHPLNAFESVLNWRSRFVNRLYSNLRSKLIVRLHALDYGWCQAQRLYDACGTLRFDDRKKSFLNQLGQPKLLIIENLSTVCLEALAANVPTICFWNSKIYELRVEAEPHFDALRKVGILWDSPEAAAAKVAAIYEDPWAWWGSDAVQEARRRFVDRFAFGRKDWVNCWVKVLEEEMALSQVKEQ